MAYKVTYTNNPQFPADRDAAAVLTATLKEAQEKAKELKSMGFANIVIFDAQTNKALEIY